MSFFNIFNSSLNSAATIPQYQRGQNQDSIDLQIKSLLYVFKRLRINKLSSFLNKDNSFRYTDDGNTSLLNEIAEGDPEGGEESEAYYQKLDQLYNMNEFQAMLIQDEYRVMVDYVKNKFRSYCLVSKYPSANLSRPNSPVKGSSTNQINEYDDDYPSFRDSRDRKIKGYRFILLPVRDISIEFIANTLSMSDIYAEHFHSFLDFNKRYQYAMESVHRVIDDTRFQDKIKSITITEDEKASIIQHYLHTTAFNIQLNRIYDEYLKQFPLVKSAITTTTPSSSPTKLRSPVKPLVSISLNSSTSPSKHQQSPKTLGKRPSIADLRISSPTKQSSPQKPLRAKPSISRLRVDESHTSPTHNPFLESTTTSSKSDISSTVSDSEDDENQSPPISSHKSTQTKTTTEFRMDIYEKCKLAIIDKLNKERAKLVV